jgi:hypothetical protein
MWFIFLGLFFINGFEGGYLRIYLEMGILGGCGGRREVVMESWVDGG